MFDVLDIDGEDKVLGNKIIHCCALLLKREISVGGLIGKFVIIDNGEPIDKAALRDLEEDINTAFG